MTASRGFVFHVSVHFGSVANIKSGLSYRRHIWLYVLFDFSDMFAWTCPHFGVEEF
jgi:hypothetical protein